MGVESFFNDEDRELMKEVREAFTEYGIDTSAFGFRKVTAFKDKEVLILVIQDSSSSPVTSYLDIGLVLDTGGLDDSLSMSPMITMQDA